MLHMSLQVGVHGAAGRMGRALIQVLHEASGVELGVAVDASGHPAQGQDAGVLAGLGQLGKAIGHDLSALGSAQVVIDFSLPQALDALMAACREHGVPLVLATTGLTDAQRSTLQTLSEQVPVVAAPNYSTGVAALFHLAARAAGLLPDFDMEIVEMHHHHKVDAPSGTALKLLDAVAEAREQSASDAVFGREGQVGARTPKEIGVMTLRGGDVVGEHTLILAGQGERLEISHRATSRAIFARGALRAARWCVDKKPGLYTMEDVLGL